MKIQNKGLVVALLLLIAALGAYGALSPAEPVAQHSASTPHNSINSANTTQTDPLNTFTDGRKALPIPEVDQEWLKSALVNGEIRAATRVDIQQWEAEAKKLNRKINKITQDNGRTFVILREIENIKANSGFITFIVPKNIPFPKEYGASTFYNMNNAGWVSITNYDDGSGIKTGPYPHKY